MYENPMRKGMDFELPVFAAIASSGGNAKAVPKPWRKVRRDKVKFFIGKKDLNIARIHLTGKVNGRLFGRFIQQGSRPCVSGKERFQQCKW